MIHALFYRAHPNATEWRALEADPDQLVLSSTHQHLVTWSEPTCWLAEATETKQSLCTEGTPPVAIIAAWARLDNREELAEALGIRSSALVNLSCSALILQAYLKWREGCTAHLYGDFCFALYDVREKRLFCARDQMGARPFYYYVDANRLVVSASLALFHRVQGLDLRPCMVWASKFLLGNLSMDFEKTAYERVLKLPPGHQLSVTATTFLVKRYHVFHTQKLIMKSSAEYVEYYRAHLDAAVKVRASVDHPLGSELSGGIDSSTVTAFALKHYQRPINDFHTFGFAYFEDEPNYILRLNQHCRIPLGYICCNISYFDHNPARVFRAMGAPVEHGNAQSHEIFYDLGAKQGVRTLLSGFGGDEFVSSIHGNLYLQELLKHKQFFKLYRNFKGNAVTRALRFAKLLYLSKGRAGLVNPRMPKAYAERWPFIILKEELIAAYQLQACYDAQGRFDNGYADLDQFTLENRWAPFVSTRLENCALMAGSYGIEYRWPLLDVRLIQCFLSIPSAEKYRQGVGRYLHKQAIAPEVPKEIIAQNSKSMGARIAQSIPRQMPDTADLNPLLEELIDREKLNAQVQRCLHTGTDLPLNESVQIKQNIYRINALNEWFNHYYLKKARLTTQKG